MDLDAELNCNSQVSIPFNREGVSELLNAGECTGGQITAGGFRFPSDGTAFLNSDSAV